MSVLKLLPAVVIAAAVAGTLELLRLPPLGRGMKPDSTTARRDTKPSARTTTSVGITAFANAAFHSVGCGTTNNRGKHRGVILPLGSFECLPAYLSRRFRRLSSDLDDRRHDHRLAAVGLPDPLADDTTDCLGDPRHFGDVLGGKEFQLCFDLPRHRLQRLRIF